MPAEDLPTPGQVATNEAARQVVLLVFGVVSAVIIMRIQSKYVKQMMSPDPDAERTARMEDARRLEKVWSKAATKVGNLAVWMWTQADKARASYEKDRA